MEQIPLVGNYTHVHKGVQPNWDAVKTDIYRGILVQEANLQAAITGTAVVIVGDITKKVADHGATRKVLITGFDIVSATERKWHEWNCKRHWDVTVVVSYYGGVQIFPEDSVLTGHYEPETATIGDLNEALNAKSLTL
ncbi:hypothetical protein ZTR_10677 [Talaromyces verruculosus]|nr:hypothetical protein ZTR_10677 [Talaromyces verruculosus]